MVIRVKIFQDERTIEIQLVRPTEVSGEVCEKSLLSNVIDPDHQNSCLFTNKGLFSSPIGVLIVVLSVIVYQ